MKDGGPAFPAQMVNDDPDERYSTPTLGMTLRDYFAAAAMQGLWACSESWHKPVEQLAQVAYKQADAMMAEREKEGK